MPSRNGPRLLESTMPRIVRKAQPPTASTLAKYGLTERDWRAICDAQKWTCPICREPFGDRKTAIDHEHVRGFKARKKKRSKKGTIIKVRVMSSDERRQHVRGVLHDWCNRFVRAWLTLSRARNIVAYLESHEQRRKKEIISAS